MSLTTGGESPRHRQGCFSSGVFTPSVTCLFPMPQPASCFLRECRDSVWLLGRAFFAPSPSAPICPALAFLLAQGLFCGADGGRFVFEGNDPAVAVVDCWARRILAPLRRAPIAPRSSPPLARGFFCGATYDCAFATRRINPCGCREV